MNSMIQVVVDSIRVNLMGPQRLIVLREAAGERYLPIWVGPFEAEAIAMPLREIETHRPLTHDLLKNVFKRFNAPIQRVEITALHDDVFYARLVALHEGEEITLDARPSDAIALALRVSAPILVSEEVMQQASFHPEAPLPDPETDPAPETAHLSAEEESPETQDRLSIFEEFLQGLDLDTDDEDDEEDDGA